MSRPARARPRLGQHFLRDTRVADRAVAFADVRASDVVLEIGPGKGVLTRPLAAVAARVVAIELDKTLAASLRAELPANVELIEGDAVKVEWPRFDLCVSNLPYQVSSPVLFKLLETPGWRAAVLMVQREFAERLVAKP
ncbi:MAG: rRNA adenine N-6-methyltransferase family protein, partial [Thermoplasmatota archaeon]